MFLETVYDNLNMDNAQLLAMQTHTTEKTNTVNTDQSTKSPATPNSLYRNPKARKKIGGRWL